MSKDIHIDLSQAGIDKAIKEINGYRDWVEIVTTRVLDTLRRRGYEKATLKFKNVVYAGELEPVDILTELDIAKRTATVTASGRQVLFIEFGTGIKYENPHMEDYGFFAGSYGKGQGNNLQGWWYAGTPQPNDPPDTEVALRFDKNKKPIKERPGWMHTHGSPANMPMYETQKELEDEITEIVREAWNDK